MPDSFCPISVIFLALFLVKFSAASLDVKLPHCTRLWPSHSLFNGHISRISATLDLSNTLCFTVPYTPEIQRQFGELGHPKGRNTLLLAFTYESTVQEYPINRKPYDFSIPHLDAHCTCDCEGTGDNCNPTNKDGPCEKLAGREGVCLRTYHPAEAGAGCPKDPSRPAEVCCEVLLTPTRQRYTAISLNGLVTTYQLRYHIFDYSSASKPDLSRLPLITHGLVKGSCVTSKENLILPFLKTFTKVKLERILTRGTLMVPYGDPTGEPRTLETDEIGEYGKGDFSQLGWFQRNWRTGKWNVPAAHAKINNRLRLISKNCKAQQYGFYLEAYFYYMGDATPNDTKLGIPISHYYYNIKESSYDHSLTHPVVYVTPKRSSIDLTVEVVGTKDAYFLNHSSSVFDFGGEIRVDQYGNRYVYIVLENAQGTIWFSIQGDENRQDLQFASYIASSEPESVHRIKRIPSFIDSDRYLCVWADQDTDHKRCRLFKVNKKPLRDVEFKEHGYQPGQTSCPGCNEFKSKTFLSWLNPVKWFSDGVEGITQTLAVTTDVAIGLIVAVLLICICKRCVLPIICSGKVGRKD